MAQLLYSREPGHFLLSGAYRLEIIRARGQLHETTATLRFRLETYVAVWKIIAISAEKPR